MENVLPFEVYERPFQGSLTRSALTSSVACCVLLTLIAVVKTPRSRGLFYPIIVSILVSPMIGFLFARNFREKMRELVRKLYEADPALVPSPPPGNFTCRVMCDLIIPPRFEVSGYLYAGPGSWVFMPHLNNPATHQSPTVLTTDGVPTLTTGVSRGSALARLLGSPPVTSLEVVSGGRDFQLYVPEAERVASALRKCSNARLAADRIA